MSKELIKTKKIPGRAPISEKDSLGVGYKPVSMLDIPENCRKELEEAGEEPRWIDVVTLKKNEGYHKREWQPKKFKCLEGQGRNPFASNGGGYEGYLVRSTLILASKSIEKATQRRKYVQMRSAMQANPSKKLTEEFRKFVSDNGGGVQVTEWDEKDDRET